MYYYGAMGYCNFRIFNESIYARISKLYDIAVEGFLLLLWTKAIKLDQVNYFPAIQTHAKITFLVKQFRRTSLKVHGILLTKIQVVKTNVTPFVNLRVVDHIKVFNQNLLVLAWIALKTFFKVFVSLLMGLVHCSRDPQIV